MDLHLDPLAVRVARLDLDVPLRDLDLADFAVALLLQLANERHNRAPRQPGTAAIVAILVVPVVAFPLLVVIVPVVAISGHHALRDHLAPAPLAARARAGGPVGQGPAWPPAPTRSRPDKPYVAWR